LIQLATALQPMNPAPPVTTIFMGNSVSTSGDPKA
jgi:hypothetical protein